VTDYIDVAAAKKPRMMPEEQSPVVQPPANGVSSHSVYSIICLVS